MTALDNVRVASLSHDASTEMANFNISFTMDGRQCLVLGAVCTPTPVGLSESEAQSALRAHLANYLEALAAHLRIG